MCYGCSLCVECCWFVVVECESFMFLLFVAWRVLLGDRCACCAGRCLVLLVWSLCLVAYYLSRVGC